VEKAPARAVISLLTGPVAEEFTMAVDLFRIEKALNPAWNGFGVHLLSTGFSAYQRKGRLKNAVQWAVHKAATAAISRNCSPHRP